MMSEIDIVTLELQLRAATISDCRFAVDTLIESITECSSDRFSALSGYRMPLKYFSLDGPTVTDTDFESRVTKIQRQETSSLNNRERIARKCLELLKLTM